jgi:hypothetical protein
MPNPTSEEMDARRAILSAICQAVAENRKIRIDDSYRGNLGEYRYQFEGEDDLLHLAITREDGRALTPEEAQAVVAWLLPGMPPGLIWIRSGEFSQHFYCGHDDLVRHVQT